MPTYTIQLDPQPVWMYRSVDLGAQRVIEAVLAEIRRGVLEVSRQEMVDRNIAFKDRSVAAYLRLARDQAAKLRIERVAVDSPSASEQIGHLECLAVTLDAYLGSGSVRLVSIAKVVELDGFRGTVAATIGCMGDARARVYRVVWMVVRPG